MTLTRIERDSFVSATPDDITYGEGACLQTPPALFELLHRRFRFDVDLTANETNHLLPRWFGPGSPWPDALAMPWAYPAEAQMAQGYCKTPTAGFSNPPYGKFIPKILKKAIEERRKGFTSVFLLPMRAARWFRELILPQYSELWYCSERLVFHYNNVPRLSAKIEWTRAMDNLEEDYRPGPGKSVIAAHDIDWTWKDAWGKAWTYPVAAGQPIMVPAGALFDSIIVVYSPYDRAKWGLFPPPQRPNVFSVRTGELCY